MNGLAAPRAFLVERPRDEFFSRSRLAANADARLAIGHVIHLRHHFAHRGALPDNEVPAEAPFQVAILVFELREMERVVDRDQKFFGGDRLFEKVDGAEARRSHRHFNRGLARHHHHGRFHAHAFQIFEQRDAVFPRHHYVRKDQIEALRFCRFHGARGAVANRRFVAGQSKCARERRQRVRVVVHNEDMSFGRHGNYASCVVFSNTTGRSGTFTFAGCTGKSMWNDVPTPVSLSTEILPP